jgi:uroporphyrinogen-III synthase
MIPVIEESTVEVPPLAGFTVGVTAARRADELGSLLERRGASVTLGSAIRIIPLADDSQLLAATRNVLAQPVDVVVATTGIGFRGWIEAAEGWGLGNALLAQLGAANVLTRGPKAKGAVRAAGLADTWSPRSESSSELLEHLLADGVAGKRIAVQLHGEPLLDFVEALRVAGADVVPVPVYRWTGPLDPGPIQRLIDAVICRQVDALTFTSAPAAANVLAMADRQGRLDELLTALRGPVLVVCVGGITAGPLARIGIPVVQPERPRIGALVRATCVALPARATRLKIGTRLLELRGQAVLAALPGGGEEHAVETAVARLRSALGESRLVQTVVKRGYRLAMEPVGARA